MANCADDTYLVISASNFASCMTEIINIDQWTTNNNLALNRIKSVEVVFAAPKSRRELTLPPPNTFGFVRMDSLKALGVSFIRTLSVTRLRAFSHVHQDNFALRTLRQHGLPTVIIHEIFQATVFAKLTYASEAQWGYSNAADRARLEGLLRRCVRDGFR
jgi:hypothetical protein